MTKHEAAVVTAYTQMAIGSMVDYQEYAAKLLGRPLFTHELMDDDVIAEIREKSRADFEKIEVV